MLQTDRFTIHVPEDCPPYIEENGGNGKYRGHVNLEWRIKGDNKFRLRFYDQIGEEEIDWPFDPKDKPAEWPTSENVIGKWRRKEPASFKYDVIINEDRNKKIDPMLVFDRPRQRGEWSKVYAVAIVTAVISFLIGFFAGGR